VLHNTRWEDNRDTGLRVHRRVGKKLIAIRFEALFGYKRDGLRRSPEQVCGGHSRAVGLRIGGGSGESNVVGGIAGAVLGSRRS